MTTIHNTVRSFILSVIDIFYPFFKKFIPLQTFRYAACGGGNTVLDIGLFILAHDIVLHKQPVHAGNLIISPYIASFLFSFCITFPVGFYLNKYVVFQEAKSASKKEQFIKYLFVVMFCLVLNYGFMKFFVEVLKWDAKFSKLVTTVFVVAFSYLSQKHFTFKLEDGTELID